MESEKITEKLPYTKKLAKNIQVALPDANIFINTNYIHIYLSKKITIAPKDWLYGMLGNLPEIDHPIETVHFVVFLDNSMELITLINPSEFNVTALDRAIADGLNFSSPPLPEYKLPMPLDHSWYSDKDYFKSLVLNKRKSHRDNKFQKKSTKKY